jgi:hypothetical protein
MQPEDLGNLIAQHKWVAVAAVIISLCVRLLKSDTKIPIDIPPQYRVWLALGLGGAAGALDKLTATGDDVTWTSALVQGLIAAAVAIVSHNVVIDSVRGGKEFVVPGLTKTNVPPGPGKPPSISPPPLPPSLPAIASPYREPAIDSMPPVIDDTEDTEMDRTPRGKTQLKMFFAIAAFALTGCSFLSSPEGSKGALVAGEIACIIQHAYLDNDALNALCKLVTPEQKAAAQQVAATYKLQAKHDAKMHAEFCQPDAGAP